MKKSIVTAALLSCAVIAVSPAFGSHSWGGYHWASDGHGVDLTDNGAETPQWTTHVNTAVADWEKSRKLSFTTQTASGVNTKKCAPIYGQILVCSDSYGQRGWLGLATIWLSDGHIPQAITQLNETYFSMPFYNTAPWRRLVACQEIAHDFGLDHQDENFYNYNLGTCMDYTAAPAGGVYNGFDYGPSNEHPNDHDYAQLIDIYSHDDGTSSPATNFGVREVGKPAADAAFSAPAGLSPAEWGRAIHRDAQGRPNVFVTDFGGGRKRVTHVLWAIGAGPGRA
jgi:hypothetical protein